MRYYVNTLGYSHPPSFDTLAEARAVLHDNVAAGVMACRRKFGRAYKQKTGGDSYQVTAAKDALSSLWGAYWITKSK